MPKVGPVATAAHRCHDLARGLVVIAVLMVAIAVFLMTGWAGSLSGEPSDDLRVLGCLGVAIGAGLLAEAAVLSFRLRRAGSLRRASVLRVMGLDFAVATAGAVLIGTALASPLLNRVTFGVLMIVLPAAQLLLVTAVDTALLIGVLPETSAPGRSAWGAWLTTCAAFNLVSLGAAFLAGRVFLWVFYPGIG